MVIIDNILLHLTKHECNSISIGDYWKANVEGKLSVLKLVPFMPDKVAMMALERLSMAYVERSELPEIKNARIEAESNQRSAINYNILISIAHVLTVKDSEALRDYLIKHFIPVQGLDRNEALEKLIANIKGKQLEMEAKKPKSAPKKATITDHLKEIVILRKHGYNVSQKTIMSEYIETQNLFYQEIQQQKALKDNGTRNHR